MKSKTINVFSQKVTENNQFQNMIIFYLLIKNLNLYFLKNTFQFPTCENIQKKDCRQQLIAILNAYKKETQVMDEGYFERHDCILIGKIKSVLKLQYIPKQLLRAVTDYSFDSYFCLQQNIKENEFEYLEKVEEIQQKNTQIKYHDNINNSEANRNPYCQITHQDEHAKIINPISYIAHINFVNLRTIEFVGLSITNVEPVTFINMPSLVCLDLSNNKITSISILSKMYFNHQCYVQLSKNRINQIVPISRFTKIHFSSFQKYFYKASIQPQPTKRFNAKIQGEKGR